MNIELINIYKYMLNILNFTAVLLENHYNQYYCGKPIKKMTK